MLRNLICTFVSLALALPSVVHGFEITTHGISDAKSITALFNRTGLATVSITNPAAGVADTLNSTATSIPVMVNVTNPTLSGSITGPANGAAFNAPATIAIAATATAAGGATVKQVDFYAGTTLVGSATSPPYGATWSNVAAGSYSLSVKVTDSLGTTMSSSPVSVSVYSTVLPASWSTQDIGDVAVPGTASYLDGAFSISGSGLDIWGNADAFRYLYQQVSGDCQIVARVGSLQNTSSYAKGGVMIRESLSPDSIHAMMDVTPSNGAEFLRRNTTGGITLASNVASVSARSWVKLVRRGNLFTGYVSSDGVAWVPVGESPVEMGATVYVGLAVVSHNTTLCASTFDGLSVTGAAVAPPAVSISTPSAGASYLAPALIPVVATATAGTGATVSRVDFYAGPMLVGTAFSSPYTITWSGVAAGGYLLSAKVTDSLGATASSGDILVTVTAKTPPYVSLTAPDNLSSYTAPATIPIAAAASAGTGAQVTRVDFFAGATLVGSASTTPYSFNWSGVGVGAYSLTAKVTDSVGDTATSSDISVTVLPRTPSSVSLTSPAVGATYNAPASLQMTASASAGSDATIAKVEFYAGSTLVGTATSAPFSITWNNAAAGTYSLTAKVTDSLGATATSTAVGITVAAAKPTTVVLMVPANGASYNAPASIALTATASAGTGATIEKVEFYAGSALVGTATAAPYSITWSNVAAGKYSLTAKATDSLGAKATSSPVTVNVNVTAGPQALSLTQDIGTVFQKGAASNLDGTYTIKNAGADIWGTADAFRFVYRAMSGDGQIIARVTTLQNTSTWAKAGVMIRQALTAKSVHAMMDVTPGNGAEFSWRTISGGSTTVTTKPVVTASYWVKLVRSGNLFTGYVSADGTSWEEVATGTVKMTGTVYVGIAMTSHTSELGTATVDNVQ